MVKPLFEKLDLDPPNVTCLPFTRFLQLLLMYHELGIPGELNGHFLPQQYHCFGRYPPEKFNLVSLISNTDKLQKLADRFGGQWVDEMRHASKTTDKYVASLTAENCYGGGGEEAALLEKLTLEEYRVLGPYLPARKSYECDSGIFISK